jgi:hypothetical protein
MTRLRIHAPRCSLAGLVAAVLSSACDPGVTVRGTVRDADGGPVVGAAVELRCPGGVSRTGAARTDDAGVFALPAILGCASAECDVVVRKPSGEEARFSVGSHCRGRRLGCGRGQCNTVEVEATF